MDRNNNDITLSPEFEYVKRLISYRLKNRLYDKNDSLTTSTSEEFIPDLPPLNNWHLPFQKFVDNNNLACSKDELVLLLIALIPHISPGFFDDCFSQLISSGANYNLELPDVGGVRGKNSRFFLPTGETILFLIAENDFKRRLEVQQLFSAEHFFWKKKIIWLEDMQNREPAMNGKLIMSQTYISLLTYGSEMLLPLNLSFPIKKIVSNSSNSNSPTFSDIIIPKSLELQLRHIASWLQHKDELYAKYMTKRNLKPGYRALFYGPSGTGKTLAAEILGNSIKKDVLKINLSIVVSKYIGETEKNIESLFTQAETNGWILYFDEADALFGKRTNVGDAHDKYANQEVFYLVRRIEDYNGLVILSTNMKNNIDEAFTRRFNSILKFPFPDAKHRVLIWNKLLPPKTLFKKKRPLKNLLNAGERSVNVSESVRKYKLNGGQINNVVHYASLKALETLHETKTEHPFTIYLFDIIEGIRHELKKKKIFYSPRKS